MQFLLDITSSAIGTFIAVAIGLLIVEMFG